MDAWIIKKSWRTCWIINSFWYLTYWTLHSLSAVPSLRSPSNNPILAEVQKNAFDYRLQTCSEKAEVAIFHPLSFPISLFSSLAKFVFLLFRTQSSRWKGIQACKHVTIHSKLQIKPSVLGFHCYATVNWPHFAIGAFFHPLFLAMRQDGRRPKWQRSVKQFQRGEQKSATRGF